MQVFRLCLVLLLVFPSATVRAEITTMDQRAVMQAEQYLNDLHTVKASFKQIAPDGSVSFGKFFLKRPGKLRWQYDPPVPILIVANDHMLAYHDFELDQISHVPTESTLAGFMARERIRLGGDDLTVKEVVRGGGKLRITLHEAGRPEEGMLTLVFDEHPMKLRKLEILDATKQLTSVSFHEAEYGLALDDELFFVDYTKRLQRQRN